LFSGVAVTCCGAAGPAIGLLFDAVYMCLVDGNAYHWILSDECVGAKLGVAANLASSLLLI